MQHKRRLLTIKEAEEMTRLSRRYLYQKIEEGVLEAYRFGKSKGMRIDKNELEAFIESNKIQKSCA